ncbi:MAG: DeoR/GlpR family DNA-binding transcription regulator [Proteobacteria bacterium]|nr:DeoR/GlpR family DNA-binding transcription regulator [Pseudomonadota bacterium]
MATDRKSSGKDARHSAILAELRASPAVRIVEMAQAQGVSTETIRRDLDELSAAGVISRTYGGATTSQSPQEPLLDERFRSHQEQRQSLAKATAPLIANGDTLMIDAGATTIHVARRLAAVFHELTVVTNSFGVASALSSNPGIKIRVCPGEYDPRDGGVIGPETVAYLANFRVRHCIIGASCFDEIGPSDFNSNSVAVKRAMIRQADATILVLGHQKVGLTTFERICLTDQLTHIVTDQAPEAALSRALAMAGVTLHIAE